ncbi:hypothetical protein JHW43_008516 [Diplocarpon mali]|nr:hypothetical protein JHW43_008516 [Diplocarpon mali]
MSISKGSCSASEQENFDLPETHLNVLTLPIQNSGDIRGSSLKSDRDLVLELELKAITSPTLQIRSTWLSTARQIRDQSLPPAPAENRPMRSDLSCLSNIYLYALGRPKRKSCCRASEYKRAVHEDLNLDDLGTSR